MRILNHRDEPSLDYAEELCNAWANKIGVSPQEYASNLPPMDKKTLKAGSRELFNSFGYVRGFMTWGVEEHCRKFPDCRYIASPKTLRYLLEKFKHTHQVKDYFAGLDV